MVKNQKVWRKKPETVGAVTHTHTHTQEHLEDRKIIAHKGNNDFIKKLEGHRKEKNVPLIVVLILSFAIIIILSIAYNIIHSKEIAKINSEIEKNIESITAETVTVSGGETYNVSKDGVYKIELNGGGSESFFAMPSNKGSKITGYVILSAGDILETEVFYAGRRGIFNFEGGHVSSAAGGCGLGVRKSGEEAWLGYVSGAPGPCFSGYISVCQTCRRTTMNSDGQLGEGKDSSDGSMSFEKHSNPNLYCEDCKKSIKHIEYSGALAYGGAGGAVVEVRQGQYGESDWLCSVDGYENEFLENGSSAGFWYAQMSISYVEQAPIEPSLVDYTVKHYKQNLDGSYSLADTDTSSAQVGTNVNGARKSYTGFNTPEEKSATIAADGTTVIEYYYTRKSYTVSLTSGTGISGTSGGGRYTYGADVEVKATLKDNTAQYTYGWSNWTGDGVGSVADQTYKFTMPAYDVSLTAIGTETVNSYLQIIQVRYENGDGSYTQYENVINRNYNYGEKVSWSRAQDDTYEAGSVEEYTVEGTNTKQVTIKRRKYQVTLERGLGISEVTGTEKYRVGQSVTVSATLLGNTAQYTYGWSKWTGTGVNESSSRTYQFTMPARDVILTANGTRTLNSYLQIIQVRYENGDGTFTEYSDVINKNYKYGETVSWSRAQDATYEAGSVEEYTVEGANTKQVTINRRKYQVTVNKNKGISSVTNSGEYKVGQKVTITAEISTGYTWKDWTSIDINGSTNKTYEFIMPTKSVTVTASATVITYNIEYTTNGGTMIGNPEIYTVETENITLKSPTKPGYNFTGWTGSNGEIPQTQVTINKGSIGDKNYIANWEARNDTRYTIKHWKQTISASAEGRTQENDINYEVDENEIQTCQGTTDTEGTGQVKQYIGFTSPQMKTVIITGDGNAVLNYYYTRNQYTLKLKEGRGISSAIATGMGTEGEKSYPYEQKVTINAKIYVGYVWDKWIGGGLVQANGEAKTEISDIKYEFNMPANLVEYEAKAIPNPDTKYTIQHWKQKIDGGEKDYENGYTLKEPEDVDVLTGETDSLVSPETRKFDGFKEPDAEGISIPITGEGTLKIRYFYKRNHYDVKLNKVKGISNIEVIGNASGEGKEQYLYEEDVRIRATVEPGYTWVG